MTHTADQSVLLGLTACWTASARAHESQRADRLFDDPWAEALAGQVGAEWLAQRTADSLTPIVLRTRFFDDFLQQITSQHNLRQIVLVAAGLDTRAFRLAWSEHTCVFELDQPAVLDHKQQVLDRAGALPRCDRRAIGVDLAAAWQSSLLAAGYEPTRPSGWLLEGLSFYLPDEAIVRLLDTVTDLAAPGSWLGLDVINRLTLTSPLTRPWIEMQAALGAPWIGTLDEPVEILAARGWAASLTQAGQPEVNHGRWRLPVIPVNLPTLPHNWLVTAHKVLA